MPQSSPFLAEQLFL